MTQALNAALRDAMADDPSVVVFGEDVGPLGGVFRVTDGLTAQFGTDRCFDTPLAESGIVGMAVGMAMNGFRPVVEMQFDAFAYPAFEQIVSHVAKIGNRTKGRGAAADGDPDPVRRRHRRGGAPLRQLRGLLRPHPRAHRRRAGHRGRRVRAAAAGDRVPRSRRVPGAEEALLRQGPGRHRGVGAADRARGGAPHRRRRHPDRLRAVGAGGDGRRRAGRHRGTRAGRRRPAQRSSRSTTRPSWRPFAAPAARSSSRRRPGSRRWRRRSRRGSPSSASTTSPHRSGA